MPIYVNSRIVENKVWFSDFNRGRFGRKSENLAGKTCTRIAEGPLFILFTTRANCQEHRTLVPVRLRNGGDADCWKSPLHVMVPKDRESRNGDAKELVDIDKWHLVA